MQKLRLLSSKDQTVLINSLGAFGIKGLALVVSMFTMPAYMRYFENQQILGVWFTLLSVLTWVLSFDFGISNGLRNHLTHALTIKDELRIRQLISSAYVIIGAVVIVLLLIGLPLISCVSWTTFLNVDEALISNRELQTVVRYTFLGIALQFFLRLINAVLYALQRSALNNLLALLSSVMQLIYVLIAPMGTSVENLKYFSISHVLCSNLPLIGTTMIIFFGKMRAYAPKLQFFDKKCAKEVVSLGGIFFLCQILYMILANTNEFFISSYTDPTNVVGYQVYHKLFSLGSMLCMLSLTPIWSAVSKAEAEGDFIWLKKLKRTIFKFSILSCIMEFLLIIPLQWIINIWLGEEAITVDYGYAFCFALFGAVMIFQTGVSTIVCGIGKMKLQATCYAIAVVVKLIATPLMISLTGDWIMVVLVSAMVLIPYCIMEEFHINKLLKKA